MKSLWDVGLVEREYSLIGLIIVQWGALEAEIFEQTLESFGTDIHVSELPKEMNNLNFGAVLKLWKSLVVDLLQGERRAVIEEAYEKIMALQDARNSIVHGMWMFSVSKPQELSTYRIKKDKLIKTLFEEGYLEQFADDIAELNAKIRYPEGFVEFLADQLRDGGYVNLAAVRRIKLESNK